MEQEVKSLIAEIMETHSEWCESYERDGRDPWEVVSTVLAERYIILKQKYEIQRHAKHS